MARKSQPIGNAKPCGIGCEFGAELGLFNLACQNGDDVGNALGFEKPECLNEMMLSLAWRDASGKQQDALVRSNVEQLADSCDAFRCHQHGVKFFGIEGAVNNRDAMFWSRVARADQMRHVIRDGDHLIAAGHDAVVEIFDAATLGIFRVIGRHKCDAGLARRPQGAPGGCPAASVNDGDVLALDNLRQTSRIVQKAEWILGRERQGDVLSPHLQQTIDQLPALGRHQRPVTSLDLGLRHLQAAKLRASSPHARNDLQNGQLIRHVANLELGAGCAAAGKVL